MWKVLVSAPYVMPVLDWFRGELEAAGCVVITAVPRERLEEADLLKLVSDVDGIVCGDDRISDRVLAAAPQLKVISKWGTGTDSIDREAATQRGVLVCSTPNAFSEPVADTVLGYLLLFARQLDVMTRDMREGRWDKPQLVSLRERTLGVIGVGHCGKAVVRRAVAFGMEVLGTDVAAMPRSFLAETGIEMTSRDDLLSRADFVSLHTDLNPTSRHLIGNTALGLMKPTAYLINTSRGSVVDEHALVRALEARTIAGAALDVFEIEPLPAQSRLREMETCFLAPHNANSSPVCAHRVHQATLRNLLEELRARA